MKINWFLYSKECNLITGHIYRGKGKHNAEYRINDSGTGLNIFTVSTHGQRPGRNGSKVHLKIILVIFSHFLFFQPSFLKQGLYVPMV